MTRRLLPLLAVAPLLGVAACGPIVQIGGNAKAPASLLALRATAVPQPGAGATTDPHATVLVLVPAVPGMLQTLRQPVITGDTTIEYLTGASWAEQPNREFQRVLADTLQAKGIPVLDPRQSTAAGGRTLSGTLLDFSLDVRSPSAAVVRVRYDAALTGTAPKGGTASFAVRRFDASAPVTSQLPNDVAIALNTAANQVAAQVADWVAH
ncbi:MAG: membrane integrity-associated transporter subunit PqiC [Sphingomonadaceae bacterium]|nr:membrane integrity-associated transporter subunit PqiC [Sphingomonadaceae bacterium]